MRVLVAGEELSQQLDMIAGRLDEPPQPGVRPDDGSAFVGAENGLEIIEMRGPAGRWTHGVDIVVKYHDQADLPCERQYFIQRRIEQARRVARHFRGNEFLVDGKLTDARENARIHQQHPAYVICRVHVRRVEPGDHRIDARAILRRQTQVLIRDDRIRERVVVELGIREQIVVGGAGSRLEVVPLLLQRNAEHGGPPSRGAHDLQEFRQAESFLDVVGQVKVGVVEVVGGASAGQSPRERARAPQTPAVDRCLVIYRLPWYGE